MGPTMRKIAKLLITGVMAVALLAAGTVSAMAGPARAQSVPMTSVTFWKNGHKVTENVPTSSLGIVTASSGLTKGDSCILDFIPFEKFASVAAEANDGMSWIKILVGELEGIFMPYADCFAAIKLHLAVATRL
jgi:hypothetical protein